MNAKNKRSNRRSTGADTKQAHQTNTYDPQNGNAKNSAEEPQELHYVTIQTNEGRYEAGLIIDDANNCPLK